MASEIANVMFGKIMRNPMDPYAKSTKKNIYKPPKGWFSTLSIMGLVGGLEHEWIMTFHSVGNFIIPTDFH
jgi:hypothetical protein